MPTTETRADQIDGAAHHRSTSVEAVRDDVDRGRGELRALGSGTADVTQELRRLAELELDLARAEMAENRGRLMTASGAGMAAGVFGFWLLGFLGVAMMLALAEVWPGWLAALATAGVWLVLAAIAGLFARARFKRFSPTPQRAMASMKEDVAWARRLMKQSGASASSGR